LLIPKLVGSHLVARPKAVGCGLPLKPDARHIKLGIIEILIF